MDLVDGSLKVDGFYPEMNITFLFMNQLFSNFNHSLGNVHRVDLQSLEMIHALT